MEKLCAMTVDVDTLEHGLMKQIVVIELRKEAYCLTTAKQLTI